MSASEKIKPAPMEFAYEPEAFNVGSEMDSSLPELNALLDSFIPLNKKVRDSKALAEQKEALALEKILSRVWLVMPYLHEDGNPGQCPIINRAERMPYGKDSGFSVRNALTLFEDGPRLVRTFAVEKWGVDAPCFQIDDTNDISCLDAIKTYGLENIAAGLVEMLRCQISIGAEYKELQNRIEKADKLLEFLQEKLHVECQASDLEEVRQDENAIQ